MARKQTPSFEEQYAEHWQRERDQIARGVAGQSGRPPMSERASDDLLIEAWNGRDPNVTRQHYAEIAQQTVQELMADRDEMGRPRWSLEQIEQEVKLRQTLATYPRRALTYTLGYADDDLEGRISEAERMAKRAAKRRPAPVDAGGWTTSEEPPDVPDGGGMMPPDGGEGEY
jgi:hypothetical protein